MSAHQVLAPMILASLLVAAVAFAFNETVVVRAARTADAWSGADYKPIPPDTRRAEQCLGARRRRAGPRSTSSPGAAPMSRLEGRDHLRARGRIARSGMIDAQLARQRPGGWRLFDARIYDTRHERGAHGGRRSTRSTGSRRRASRSPRSTPTSEDFRVARAGDRRPRPRRPPDRRGAQRLVAQDQRAVVDRADAVARRGSPRSGWRDRGRC